MGKASRIKKKPLPQIVRPFFEEDEKTPKKGKLLTVKEAFEAAGLEPAENIEAQKHRLAKCQSALSRYALKHPQFCATKAKDNLAVKYGWTGEESKIISDVVRRKRRVENGLDNYSQRQEPLLEKFPGRKEEIALAVRSSKVILIKKWSPKEIRNKVLYG